MYNLSCREQLRWKKSLCAKRREKGRNQTVVGKHQYPRSSRLWKLGRHIRSRASLPGLHPYLHICSLKFPLSQSISEFLKFAHVFSGRPLLSFAACVGLPLFTQVRPTVVSFRLCYSFSGKSLPCPRGCVPGFHSLQSFGSLQAAFRFHHFFLKSRSLFIVHV